MYCKGQLVQLQRDAPLLSKAGLGLAAISYDSPAVLSEFAKRKSITFPLLADHESEVIRAYGMAVEKYKKGMQLDVYTEQVYTYSTGNVPVFGLSNPGVLVLGRDRRVRWRFVSEGEELRLTGAAILEESVGGIADASRTPLASRHIEVSATATNAAVGLGNRFRIALEINIPPGFHVYGPQVGGGYKGLSWQMDKTDCMDIGEASYPNAELKLMKSTGETLPVYEGALRISREAIVKPIIKPSDPSVFKTFSGLCLDAASHLKLTGVLRFQACDETQCYPPQSVQPQWRFEFIPPNRQRSSDDLRREFEP